MATEYTDASVLKVTADGQEVMSDHVDHDAGEFRRYATMTPPSTGEILPVTPDVGSMTTPTPVVIIVGETNNIGDIQLSSAGASLLVANDGTLTGYTVLSATTISTVFPAGSDNPAVVPDVPLDVELLASGFGKGAPPVVLAFTGAFRFSS